MRSMNIDVPAIVIQWDNRGAAKVIQRKMSGAAKVRQTLCSDNKEQIAKRK